MSGNNQADIQEHIKVYLTVFGALAVLTILTVSASYLEVSNTEAIFLALTIATIKASLVAGYFMHLITEKQTIVWILILTFFFFLVLMFFPFNYSYGPNRGLNMISLKTFHLFFIAVSILLTGYYGLFELNTPTSPGNVSYILSGFSFLISILLIAYSVSIVKKFREI